MNGVIISELPTFQCYAVSQGILTLKFNCTVTSKFSLLGECPQAIIVFTAAVLYSLFKKDFFFFFFFLSCLVLAENTAAAAIMEASI